LRRSRRPRSALDGVWAVNRIELSGRLRARDPQRYTPAGIPVIEFRLEHESEQEEAGHKRRVSCEIACVVLGGQTGLLAATNMGDALLVRGFLAAKSLKNQTPVLHVNEIEFQEGNENGIQT
jgi:primosomal replication protein N